MFGILMELNNCTIMCLFFSELRAVADTLGKRDYELKSEGKRLKSDGN